MIDRFSKPTENSGPKRNLLTWTLFPLALFPLLALATYDWRAIAALNLPPLRSANAIGPLGDFCAYYGYLLFGLPIWIVPAICIVAALCGLLGRKMTILRRGLWSLVFLVAASCLIEVLSHHLPLLSALTVRINIANAGGAIGYLIMTRALAPLISDFGAAIIAVIVMSAALIAAVGAHNIADAAIAIFHWALGPMPRPCDSTREEADGDPSPSRDREREASDAFDPIQQAREEVRRQKEEAKRLAREEKERAREEKERAKAEYERLKEAARQRQLADNHPPTPAPAGRVGGGGTAETRPGRDGVPPPSAAPAKPAASAAPAAPAENTPYVLPSLALLNPLKKSTADHGDVGEMRQRLVDTLKLFGVDASVAYDVQGPVVTKYALSLAPGTKYSAVTNISDNLMGALRAKSLRIEAPIPGEDHIGVEVPNRTPAGISFREIFESDAWRNFKGELPLLFGKDAAGAELVADLAKMPHMLVAGATGQGKSVCLNAIINGLLMTKTPEQLKLIMVDPKSVEFTSYSAIPHLIVPIITENRKAATSLAWAVGEMEKRLKLFARAKVRNIYDFNHRLQFTQTDMFGNDQDVGADMPRTVPYIVIIIDEVADLMSQCAKEVVPHISRLTAKARAAGIHLILATQRPDAKVITGTIKANIPGRVAFKTATAIDSRTILDDSGAENLIGRGDMLFKAADGVLVRAQGAWITDDEIARVTAFIEAHSTTQFDATFKSKLERIKEQEIDPFAEVDAEDNQAEAKAEAEAARAQVKADAAADDFKKAVECVINTGRASTSHFQRQMGWGYNHAAKILDMLTERGVVSKPQGMGARQIIMNETELMALFNGSDEPAPEATNLTPEEENNDPDRTDPEVGA